MLLTSDQMIQPITILTRGFGAFVLTFQAGGSCACWDGDLGKRSTSGVLIKKKIFSAV